MLQNSSKTSPRQWITVFVIIWTLLFHYESTRYFYVEPFVGHSLPKLKFLFPPAGWIMFYNIDDGYGLAEVYGVKNHNPEFIDPHRIFETKAVLYDNIHRNVLSSVLSPHHRNGFCRFLERKFPGYDDFYVMAAYYPSLIKAPGKKLYHLEYSCR